MLRKTLAAAVAVLALGLASTASAAIKVADISGTLDSGSTNVNLFGVGSNLAHQAVDLRFVYDTSISHFSTSGADLVTGGSIGSFPSPMLDTSVTINGVTVHMTVGFNDYVLYSLTDQTYAQWSSQDSGSSYIFGSVNLIPMPQHIADDLSETGGCFDCEFRLQSSSAFSVGSFSNATVRVRDLAEVPEPAVWTLMIAGFGLAGAALRRRRASLTMA